MLTFEHEACSNPHVHACKPHVHACKQTDVQVNVIGI